jgi:hypothetical protein
MLSDAQLAALARVVEIGGEAAAALVADAAAGVIDPLDLARWVERWAEARRAEAAKWGWKPLTQEEPA